MVRINQLLERQDEVDYPATKNPFAGRQTVSISVEDLYFAYGEEQVLSGLNFNIAAGEKVAIVGASGGGKSTLVQLLLGLYTAQSGSIRYADAALQETGLACVREHVAVVLQAPALFNDSLRANLCMGREYSDQACWQALTIAQLAQTVKMLPAGLDSIIGRAGVRLSGGQRQRLAIARMVLSDPKVVILDEATSALDSATEFAVHEALNQFLAGRTTLIIAHRLSAVKQADRILVLADGQVAEDGTHQQLLNEEGLYAQLYGALQC
jgi:ATP-binding cassette subfamily C protein